MEQQILSHNMTSKSLSKQSLAQSKSVKMSDKVSKHSNLQTNLAEL